MNRQDIEFAINIGTPVDILCLGNPVISGDAIGPMVGDLFKNKTVALKNEPNVIGNTMDPVTRSTYYSMIAKIRPGAVVIVVDACVGEGFPHWTMSTGSIKPGSFVHESIQPIGHLVIRCYTGLSMDSLISFPRKHARRLSAEIYYTLQDLLGIQK